LLPEDETVFAIRYRIAILQPQAEEIGQEKFEHTRPPQFGELLRFGRGGFGTGWDGNVQPAAERILHRILLGAQALFLCAAPILLDDARRFAGVADVVERDLSNKRAHDDVAIIQPRAQHVNFCPYRKHGTQGRLLAAIKEANHLL
jgi:hypothetical protein